MIDFAAREEEVLLEEAARRFADELRGAERVNEAERRYPDALRTRYAVLGFDAIALPEALGGGGLPLAIAAVTWQMLATGDPAAPIALGIPGLASLARTRPELARSRVRGAVVVIDEPTLPLSVPWVPCERPAWLAIVSPDGVGLVRDPAATPIVGAPCGLRAAGAARIVVDQPGEPIGDAAEAARWLVELRVLAGATMLGAARDASAYARRYAGERVAFGRPIAHHQGLAFALVDAATDLDATGLLLASAATSEDATAVAAAYGLAVETALHVVERSLQALGGHGYLYDHPVEKRMRDVRALASLYGGAIAAERDAAERVLTLRDPLEVRP